MNTRGHWPAGRRRNDGDGRWMRGVPTAQVAAACGVSYRTAARWQSGEDMPPLATVMRLIEVLWPLSAGSMPLAGAYPLDGDSRVGGVGEYTIRAAQGDTEYVGESWLEIA